MSKIQAAIFDWAERRWITAALPQSRALSTDLGASALRLPTRWPGGRWGF